MDEFPSGISPLREKAPRLSLELQYLPLRQKYLVKTMRPGRSGKVASVTSLCQVCVGAAPSQKIHSRGGRKPAFGSICFYCNSNGYSGVHEEIHLTVALVPLYFPHVVVASATVPDQSQREREQLRHRKRGISSLLHAEKTTGLWYHTVHRDKEVRFMGPRDRGLSPAHEANTKVVITRCGNHPVEPATRREMPPLLIAEVDGRIEGRKGSVHRSHVSAREPKTSKA